MEPVIVSNQTEYTEACKTCWDILDKNLFVVIGGKNSKIVKKVERFISDYLHKGISREDTEKGISRIGFEERSAKEIINFFITHRRGDLYDIEQGLNYLALQHRGALSNRSPILIENSKERISVQHPVEVYGKSQVAAFQCAKVFAHDNSRITAFNQPAVYALDNSFVEVFDQSHVVTRNRAYVTAWPSALVNAEGQAVIIARDNVKVAACQATLVFLQDDAACEAADNAQVITRSQNKPELLQSNVILLLDHPYIDGNPVTAVKLLLAAADPKDSEAFSQKLKEMGCRNPESTRRVFRSLTKDLPRRVPAPVEPDDPFGRY
jgi:hypothetical protein